MNFSVFSSRPPWLIDEFPNSAYDLFCTYTTQKNPSLDPNLQSYESLGETLNRDFEFGLFWQECLRRSTSHRIAAKSAEDKFWCIVTEAGWQDKCWVRKKYKEYRLMKAFNKLSEEQKTQWQKRFDNLKLDVYEAAKRHEARQEGCTSSDIKQNGIQLPFGSLEQGASKLVNLPNGIFANIMGHLGPLDIFRMTMVCRTWKNQVFNNTQEFRKAEHSIIRHFITFTEWMDTSRGYSLSSYKERYSVFSRNLILWYCTVSQNVESLCFDKPIPIIYLLQLLQLCPNLKCLQLKQSLLDDVCLEGRDFCSEFHLPDLEILCLGESTDLCTRYLAANLVSEATSLQAYKGPLMLKGWQQEQDIFHNVVALHATCLSRGMFQELSELDGFNLKYLRLDFASSSEINTNAHNITGRAFLHNLLPKLEHLEMLILGIFPGVSNGTINLLTTLRMKLKFALLFEGCSSSSYLSDINDGDDDGNDNDYSDQLLERDVGAIELETLIAFQQMILETNPDAQLSDFCFFLNDSERAESVKKAHIGFSIYDQYEIEAEAEALFTSDLCDASIRRQLNLTY